MSRWFRLYADAMRNPKVMRLSDKEFRLWVRLLAVASEHDGKIPHIDDLKLLLSMRLDHLSSALNQLISGRLIDVLDDGYEPHGWVKFQYKSDTSTDRVKKFRGKRNVSETPPDTEADTDKVLEDKPLTPAPKARGMRIPANFQPAAVPAPIAELLAQWPPGREQRELEGFRDYWSGRVKDATKLDWDKTWHNRIRDQHDRIMRENRNGSGHWQRDRERAAQHPEGVSGLAWDDAFEAMGVGRTGAAPGEARLGSAAVDPGGYSGRAIEARRLNG